MKTTILLLGVFCLVGCAGYRINGHINETRTTNVGSPMLSWSEYHFGGGGEASLNYLGQSDGSMRLGYNTQNYTVTRGGFNNWGQAMTSEATYPATSPQEITFQNIKLRIDKLDANSITFTPLAFPEGYKEQ